MGGLLCAFATREIVRIDTDAKTRGRIIETSSGQVRGGWNEPAHPYGLIAGVGKALNKKGVRVPYHVEALPSKRLARPNDVLVNLSSF